MKKVLIALPEDLIIAVKKLALDRDVSFKALVAEALRQHVERPESTPTKPNARRKNKTAPSCSHLRHFPLRN